MGCPRAPHDEGRCASGQRAGRAPVSSLVERDDPSLRLRAAAEATVVEGVEVAPLRERRAVTAADASGAPARRRGGTAATRAEDHRGFARRALRTAAVEDAGQRSGGER